LVGSWRGGNFLLQASRYAHQRRGRFDAIGVEAVTQRTHDRLREGVIDVEVGRTAGDRLHNHFLGVEVVRSDDDAAAIGADARVRAVVAYHPGLVKRVGWADHHGVVDLHEHPFHALIEVDAVL